MTTDLNTLLTALYVKIDDEIGGTRWMGRPPLLSDSELVCLAVAQALLGYHFEARWLRYPRKNLSDMFPYLPQRRGYSKRLKFALPLLKRMIRELAMDSAFWTETIWIADSTPVPCGMSRPTVQRSNMAGWAGYGYCASHSRFFWGLRLYLVCTPTGMPIMWALANPKIGEREVLSAMLEVDADLVAARDGILLITDKGFASKPFERDLTEQGIELLRPSLKREKKRYGEPMLKKVRQLIESVNDTLKGQLDLEQHGGRTFEGVAVRVTQRVLIAPCCRSRAATRWRRWPGRRGHPGSRCTRGSPATTRAGWMPWPTVPAARTGLPCPASPGTSQREFRESRPQTSVSWRS